MEDEHAAASAFAFHYQKILSEYWISGLYESLRLLRERELLEQDKPRIDLFKDIELVRILVDKHEIAKERKFLKEPVEMVREPRKNNPSDTVIYDPADKQRGHIAPVARRQDGSVAWHATDLAGGDRWVVRRDVSDRVLSLWGTD
jgi:hypothetical protein